jgi:hypothetical protein
VLKLRILKEVSSQKGRDVYKPHCLCQPNVSCPCELWPWAELAQETTPQEKTKSSGLWGELSFFFFFFFFFHFSFIIHMCIQSLVHFSPLPPPPPLPPTPPPPAPPPPIPSRNYFALISNFVVERV